MMDLLPYAALIAVIGGFVDLDSTAAWQFMVSQPLVAAPLTGLALGFFANEVDYGLRLGLMVGTILQLVWIEQLPLGMNIPPDAALASVLSVALGYLGGKSFDTFLEREVCSTAALLIAVALGLVGRSMDIWLRKINTYADRLILSSLESGNPRWLEFGHFTCAMLTFFKAFLFCFITVMLGVEPLRYFTQSLNFNQCTGFIVIQGLLPVIGFAVLATKLINTRREAFSAIGGILLFTFLPAYLWLALVAGFVMFWRHLHIKSSA
ncbi:MAG: PTS sugar transporter subunit IIC [Candidatus Riflebacteria bacterium]|nr:PTS sugar transporter subunit IIC [Candidatus Riflebacteria bacterium]